MLCRSFISTLKILSVAILELFFSCDASPIHCGDHTKSKGRNTDTSFVKRSKAIPFKMFLFCLHFTTTVNAIQSAVIFAFSSIKYPDKCIFWCTIYFFHVGRLLWKKKKQSDPIWLVWIEHYYYTTCIIGPIFFYYDFPFGWIWWICVHRM